LKKKRLVSAKTSIGVVTHMGGIMLRAKIERILPQVAKPARYLGNEYNSIHKDWESTPLKMAFCFPDIYEIAMSHLGLRILYGLVNETKEYLMERCFAPWVDMEAKLKEEGIPLFSLESYKPLKDFDVLGFTLQYEMSYTNILNMLHLAKIPFKREDRDHSFPLIIAGGPCVFNPEPLADFIDFFLLGDAEELLPEVLGQVKDKYLGKGLNKSQFLDDLAKIPGIYVPELYKVDYNHDGIVKSIVNTGNAPAKVKKGVVKNFDEAYFPTKPILPYVEAVHDRVMLEVARGCTRGCRFCQAGMIYRPVREKKPQTLERQAYETLENTGYEEISLTSLSSVDYSGIELIVKQLLSKLEGQRIGISLPSLRVDAFSVDLVKEIQKVRKTGLTFAPEAGTQRLRDVINKGVTEKDIEASLSGAFEAGWDTVKLYFMIGLPTETEEDIKGIVRLAYKVLAIGKDIKRRYAKRRQPRVTVSVSSFVPKPHTPFQWEPQDRIETLKSKQQLLKKNLRDKAIIFNYHQAEVSFLEAVFSKGDRRLGMVLQAAWEKGCKFDSWNEHFNYSAWLQAFAENQLDPDFYAYRKRKENEVFPWDMIDAGVTKAYLKKEYQNALSEIRTHDCRDNPCPGCGICPRFGVDMELAGGTQ
jgi:radical SAM family uncharacterized protein